MAILPTAEQIEDYLESLEELFYSSLSASTPDLPNVREAINRLWEDVSRFGPQALPPLPDIKIPGLGPFEVPPPPPPPPPPKAPFEMLADWAESRRWTIAAVGLGAISIGVLASVGGFHYKRKASLRKLKVSATQERRQVVLVLGGDSPLGLPLILDLERKGYIGITSVSSPEAVDQIEAQGNGYVRALVLDPSEPETIPFFLRSLSSTLSRRFPITTAGDPHANPAALPYIHSIISLLTLPAHHLLPSPGPLEHLSLRQDYSGFLQATHITPLQVIQALLPLLRNSSARTRDLVSNNHGRKSVIVCLPAIDARVGLPFTSAQAMSAAATLRGVEVLRREIRAASLSDKSGVMKNIKVVVVDVGAIDVVEETKRSPEGVISTMDDWTPSEKATYGTAFASLLVGRPQSGKGRKPTKVSSFVHAIVGIVRDGERHRRGIYDIGLGLAKFREWIKGDRVVVGAGAGTYTFASHLPALILDALLNIPHLLISIRNALVPIPLPPRVALPHPPPVPPGRGSLSSISTLKQPVQEESPINSDQEHHDNEHSETGSEADVESNEGYGSGVGESWISVKGRSPERV